MNTEIFDYLKALSKREFYFANLFSSICSIVVIIAGVISIVEGASMLLYAIMFGGAAITMGINSYKGFRRKNKNAIFFAGVAIFMLVLAGMFAYALMLGGTNG